MFNFKKSKNQDKIKLHLGCGKNYFEGWINLDNNTDRNIKKLDIKHDLRKKLPFKDNTVDFIYNEHLIEHLTVDEGVKLLKGLYRILKPEGVLRIATPGLEYVISQYVNNNWKEQEWVKKYHYEWLQTKAEFINLSFREWGHKFLYDEEELIRRFKEAGFENLSIQKNGESNYVELAGLETRKESTLIIEGIK